MKSKKIAIIHDWDVVWEQEYTWRDGLCAAVKELSKRHDVKFFVAGPDNIIPHPYFPIYVSSNIKKDVEEFKPDVILMWGDCTRPNAEPLSQLGIPMALCFAGGNPMGHTARYFDHFFVESAVYYDEFKSKGFSVSTAFGTNTEIFKPIPDQTKSFDAIFPATFCTWKRHPLFAEAVTGLKSCSVGWMYPVQENFCWKACEKAGSLVLPHVSAETLARLYASSKTCVITSRSDGGSQRTVLEAMAMNIPVICCSDSNKTSEYVRECGQGAVVEPKAEAIRLAIEEWKDKKVNTRDYIMEKWSEYVYADNLEAGLLKLL